MRLSKLEPLLGASRFDVGNWLKRHTMTSSFETVVSGQARTLTYANAIELSLVAAFVAAGLTAPKAIACARPLVASARGPLARYDAQEWIIFPGGASDPRRFIMTDKPDFASLQASLGDVIPPSFGLVCIGEVFRRVDALFTEDA